MNGNELITRLNKNRVRNINLINFIKTYPILRVEEEGDSLLVKGKSDQDWVYFSSEDTEEFDKLLGKLTLEDKYFVVQGNYMLSALKQRGDVDWVLSCRKLYCPDNIDIPVSKSRIDLLKENEGEYIYQHYEYKQYTSEEYIIDRLRLGLGLGINIDNKLVAFIMTQDDGAIGFLTVLPEYRRRGYAEEITLEMIRLLRERGELPFVHIEEDNFKSMNLAIKTGFIKDEMVHWVKFK